jgi:uncharacterized protein (TIGR00369 family)
VDWSERLDAIVTKASSTPPPMVATLRLPGIDGWEHGRAWVDWMVDPLVYSDRGTVFGGYLAALVDSIGGLAMMTTLSAAETFTTANVNVSFLRPVAEGNVRIEGSVVHRGRRMAHVEVTFTDEQARPVVRGVVTQIVMPLD